MPTITDWIMVAITAIYVVATIFICIFNGRSARAAYEQTRESQKQSKESKIQFDELRRLQIMPFLQLELVKDTEADFQLDFPVAEGNDLVLSGVLIIKNVGLGAATNIIYSWKASNNCEVPWDPFVINAIRQGDYYRLMLVFTGDYDQELPASGTLSLEYTDMLGQSYTQSMNLIFDNSDLGSGLTVETDSPNYLGLVKFKAVQSDK